MNQRSDIVEERPLQLALREWRQHMRHPKTLAALLAVAAVLGVAGPFDTSEHLRLIPRLLYWLVIVAASYSCGFLVDSLLRPSLQRLADWPKTIMLGLITGCGVTVIVLAMNVAVFNFFPPLASLPAIVLPIVAISMIITVTSEVMTRSAEPGADAMPATVPILERLPLAKRGALVALSVEDHYVRVQTVNGEEMILMRLADAIREVGATPGAHVHRSHWVAFAQVVDARRAGDRALLTLSNRAEIPVSRANIHKLKDAGILPK